MKQTASIVPASAFSNLQNKAFDNPDFEKDLAVYNASLVGRYSDDEEPEQNTSETVHLMYVPRSDSTFTYHDSKFQVRYTDERAEVPQGVKYIVSQPAKLTLKTNLLYTAATYTPNLSLEVGLGRRTSLDLTGSYNPWKLKGTREDNTKFVHWIVRPEFRYWLCERSNGHFFGASVIYWQYNISGYDIPLLFEREYRYEGNAVGAGLSYGYHLPLSRHWGLEFNAGLGVLFMEYDRYTCAKCNRDKSTQKKTYFGPTQLGIKLVFLIK